MSRSSRKLDHINQALHQSPSGNGFEDITFVHNSLPNVNMSQINLQSSIGGLHLSSPIIINAMTGGANEAFEINKMLAFVANETGVPMAVGSQMAALKDHSLRHTYAIARKSNSNGILMANLGGEATIEQALAAVEMIEANALQIHLNPMQELIMPEGVRNFQGVLERIGSIVNAVQVPVIVKEVGFGMSRETCLKLVEIGVSIVDVGGKGGTNFAAIENTRRDLPIHYLNDWGINTCTSLLEVSAVKGITSIIASGGITNGMDIAKSIALGASAAAIAGTLLKVVVNEGVDEAIMLIKSLQEQLRLIMTALGTCTIEQLQQSPVVVSGETKQWCDVREIDLRYFAQYKNERL